MEAENASQTVAIKLVADNASEIPFSALAEFKVIGIVAGHGCGYAFGAANPIDLGSAGHESPQISRCLTYALLVRLRVLLGDVIVQSVFECLTA